MVESDLAPNPYQKRLLGPRAADQTRVVSLLFDEGSIGALSLACRIGTCARNSTIAVKPDGTLRVCELRCRSKLCPICSKKRASAVYCRTLEAIRKMNSPRMLTLTLAHSDIPLREQLLRLRRCFAELRRAKDWKARVKSGIYCLEITHNPKEQRWHPHIHMIVDGTYFDNKLLRSLWLRVTKDSSIVHVRKVNDAKNAAQYVSKYISKSLDPAGLNDAQLLEWITEVRGLRFVQTFGELHGVKLDTRDTTPSTCETLTNIGPCDQLAHAANTGDQEAAKLLTFVIACRHRRIRDGGPRPPCKPQAGEREIVDRLWTWFRHAEKAHRDHASDLEDSRWLTRARDRTERQR